jgi:ketosteroid isomerase-like protein
VRNRNQILAMLDALYEARVKGDKEMLASCWAPGATFRIVGGENVLGEMAGPAHPAEAIGALIDQVQFHSAERLYSIVEGSKAVIHWRVQVSPPGGDPVPTELLDVWEFDEDGKARSLVQFIDTALAGSMFAEH